MKLEKVDYLPWAVSGMCCLGSLRYPAHATTIWIVGMGSLLPLLWHELRKPVNYVSLEFDSVGFVFQSHPGTKTSARWAEVKDVLYCRVFNDFANQTETEWHFLLADGKWLEVLVEWPHRARFAKALIRHLAFVSPQAVGRVARERTEGRWSVAREHVRP